MKHLFQPGNPGGPGRPRRQTEAAYLEVVLGACSLDDWREIVSTAVAEAKGGDPKSREWLAKYLIGTPEAGRAPSPTAVLVEALIGGDPVLERAVMRIMHDASGLILDLPGEATEQDRIRAELLAGDPAPSEGPGGR